jgi:hypothetical protein
LEWERSFGGTKNDAGVAIRVWPSRAVYYILGYTASNDNDAANINHGGDSGTTDMFLLKLDYNGNLLSSHCYGGSLDDFAVHFGDRATPEGSVYIAGGSNSNDCDLTGLVAHGDSDIAVFELSNALSDGIE